MMLETFHYGDEHNLQTVTITKTPNPHDNSFWVILIHGGAWRDPTNTSLNYLNPAASILSNSPISSHITAFASIDYRLSPHPLHPQDPSTTKCNEYRSARHPEHIHDVQAALVFLQRKYGFGERYILVGHSCGATLALQTVMGRFRTDRPEYANPIAILGMEGIYDLRLLRDMHKDISAYQQFIEGAFGPDEDVWDLVSPAVVESPAGVDSWETGRLIVLAHSTDDTLVDPAQPERIRANLARWEKSGPGPKMVEVFQAEGEHDDAWIIGEELARAVTFTLQKLQDMDL